MIFIQNKNYYNHHILSIIISFVVLIIFHIFFPIKSNISFNIFLFLNILKGYCYSLNLLLIKYINEIYFINIYLLGGINGLFELIFEMIYYIIKIPEIILFDQQYYYIILMVIIYIIFNYLFYFIVNKYEPIYSLLCDMIPEIVIFNILGEYYSIGELIIFIILIFFIMVYLEIIQLNFCGLNTNLKIIRERGILDLESISQAVLLYNENEFK